MSESGQFTPPALAALTESHKVDHFDSGEPSLDSWLRDHALTQARRRLSATHVWADSDGRVVGYITLAAGAIAREELTRSLGHGFPETIPVTLLARLALHRNLQGQGLGGVLLTEALGLVVRSAADIAAAFVVVDALDEEAARFYEHYGFKRLSDPSRLALKTNTIAAA